jgi:uncharacterized membrane protein YdjX (TVP38/TMEM64 family)
MKKYSFERRARTKPVEATIRQLNRVRWKYRNLLYLAVALVVTYMIATTDSFDAVVSELRSLEYLGIAISGMLYAFSVTTLPATAIFYKLGYSFNPLVIAAVGALGCVVSDYLIFRFVKNNLMDELRTLTDEVGSRVFFRDSLFYKIFPFSNLLMSKEFRVAMFKVSRSNAWRNAMVVLGSAVIMLPIPDEIGIAILGAVDFRTKYFLLMSYCLNFAGIFMIAYLGGL